SFFIDMSSYLFFPYFFNATATAEIYTLSLHDALPIFSLSSGADRLVCGSLEKLNRHGDHPAAVGGVTRMSGRFGPGGEAVRRERSEEHTSELQSRENLVCRLLLEKKKKIKRQ